MVRQLYRLLLLCALFIPIDGLVVAQASPEQAAVNLDIVGIKLGMSTADALRTLKADNPRLKLTPSAFKYQDLPNPLTFTVDGTDIAPTANAAVEQASERIQILLTTAPSQEVVWGVLRNYTFPMAQRPSMQTTVDALRKKYEPESVPAGPPNTSQRMVWVYDAQGNPMGPSGARLSRICESTLNIYTWDDTKMAVNSDVSGPSPRAWPPECTSLIIVSASVSGVQISANTFALATMEVRMQDGGRYRKALDATRQVLLNAAKAREDAGTNQVNQRPVPKL